MKIEWKKFVDPNTWRGSLTSNVIANIVWALGVWMAAILWQGSFWTALGFAVALSLLLFGSVTLVRNLIKESRELSVRTDPARKRAERKEITKQKRLTELFESLLKEGDSGLDFSKTHDWLNKTGTTIWALCDQTDVDKFNAICGEFRNWIGVVPMGIGPKPPDPMAKVQTEVKAFLKAIAIKYWIPSSS